MFWAWLTVAAIVASPVVFLVFGQFPAFVLLAAAVGEAWGSGLCLCFFGWWRFQHPERQFYRGAEPKDDEFAACPLLRVRCASSY